MSITSLKLPANSTVPFLRPYFYRQKNQGKQIESDEIRALQETISLIIRSKDHIADEFNKKSFIKAYDKIICRLYDKHGFKKINKLDLEIYEMCMQKIDQSGLSNENKDKIHYLLDSLKDYTLNIVHILEREKELDNMLAHFDYKDFERSLYGSMLAFICIMVGILESASVMAKTDVLTRLIDDGFKSASDLDSYTDTIDILTNPDELDLLKKSESSIK